MKLRYSLVAGVLLVWVAFLYYPAWFNNHKHARGKYLQSISEQEKGLKRKLLHGVHFSKNYPGIPGRTAYAVGNVAKLPPGSIAVDATTIECPRGIVLHVDSVVPGVSYEDHGAEIVEALPTENHFKAVLVTLD